MYLKILNYIYSASYVIFILGQNEIRYSRIYANFFDYSTQICDVSQGFCEINSSNMEKTYTNSDTNSRGIIFFFNI